jgi:hypothetical protein
MVRLTTKFTGLPATLNRIEDERGIRFAFTIEEKTGRLYCEYEPSITVPGLMKFFLVEHVRHRELTLSTGQKMDNFTPHRLLHPTMEIAHHPSQAVQACPERTARQPLVYLVFQ